MKTALRLWLTFGLVMAQAQTYPAAPVLTTAGNLSCGIRLYAPLTVQAYCFYFLAPAPPVTVCNSLSVLNSSSTTPVAASFDCTANEGSTLDEVGWLVFPMPDGTVDYQVAWQSAPCQAPTTAGNLVACSVLTRTQQLQTGTLPQ